MEIVKSFPFFLATLHDYVGDHDDNDLGGGDYDNDGDEAECDEYIQIFKYIHEYLFGHFLCQICLYEYIRTYVCECVRE